jgi:hypothetical protein
MILELTAATGFLAYFLWSAGKIFELKRRLCATDAAFLKAVIEHAALTERFKELNAEVKVKHREVTQTFDSLLHKLATLRAAQNSNQHVN